jgi:hypothetical protein
MLRREKGFYPRLQHTFAPPSLLIMVTPERTMPLSPKVRTCFFPLHLCQKAIPSAFHL